MPQVFGRTSATRRLVWLALAVALLVGPTARAADLGEARKRFLAGAYEEVIATAMAGRRETPGDLEWPLLLGEALGSVGRYADAAENLLQACKDFPLDLRVRFATWRAARQAGDPKAADTQLKEIERLATIRLWAYRTPADRITLGRVALIFGNDPKKVLEQFYDPIRKAQPELRDSYLATGELALEKSDFALAARNFNTAVKKFPEDPEAWFGLARAYAPSDSEAMLAALQKTFDFNPYHAGAWLLLANMRIDAEEYGEAEVAIQSAFRTNPHDPEAHAYASVLAHLRNDAKAEAAERTAALKLWRNNPAVPHLIGRKLSQKYRFAEGAALQREALKFDPAYVPAKSQLANDLLRLGKDDEGWKLAEEVQRADPYDVVAYNLSTLRDVIAKFRMLNSEHFTIRMDPREADIYGQNALALLERAHDTLTKKYGLTLREKTIVEIFPDQKDFAIRTFGLPGGAGYLGVCFGRVITANSPASRPGSPSNWEAILWHEFCHVVTLTATKNKMPRWLSEGISVFEERQARSERSNSNGSWGEQMKPRYRAMILGEDLTPVSQLSGSFLKPKTPMHLGFAYYESSLAVEWLIGKWGLEKMKQLLADLARGTEINAALAAHFAPIEQLDADFAKHAQALAKNTGAKLDWMPPKPAELASDKGTIDFIVKNPNNYTALTTQAERLIEGKQWEAAKAPLQKLIERYPDQHGADSAYAMLARVQRELGETDAEIATLARLADLAADATDAFERLMKLHAERQEWPQVLDYAARYQAVDPLRPEPHRFEAEACEATGKAPAAIAAYRTLSQLGPTDPAGTHFRLASLLHAAGD
ncbi:MAG: tetratricopeptide repeat protein, partial [Chthoniobacteraceae bacterium]